MILKITGDGKYRHSEDMAFRQTDGETMIIPTHRGVSTKEDVLFTLTDTGELIWSLLDGERTVRQVIDNLMKVCEVSGHQVTPDVFCISGRIGCPGLDNGLIPITGLRKMGSPILRI